jgi:hypothetical protein
MIIIVTSAIRRRRRSGRLHVPANRCGQAAGIQMQEKENAGRLNACPSCGNAQSYLTRRCGACGHQHNPLEMLRIAGGLLEGGTSQRSLRRQISEAGRGIGGEILKAASKLFGEIVESTSIIALIAARDFGDPRIIKGKRLEIRYPFASQALRVEIAQTLTAAQTEESRDIIGRLKGQEKDERVLKAFDEPLVSSEGLSFSLDTNLRAGKSFDAKDDEETLTDSGVGGEEKGGGGKAGSPSKEIAGKGLEGEREKMKGTDEEPKEVPEERDGKGEEKTMPGGAQDARKKDGGADAGQAGKPETPGAEDVVKKDAAKGAEIREEDVESEEILAGEPETEVLEEEGSEHGLEEEGAGEEEGRDMDDEEIEEGEPSGSRVSVPPPLPPAGESSEAEEDEAGVPGIPEPQAAVPVKKKAEKKDYSVLFFTAVGIVLLGAIIGYGVIKLRKDGSDQDREGKGSVQEKGGQEKGQEKEGGGTGTEKESGEQPAAPVSHIISVQVAASSEHPKYPASNVIDGDPGTVWQEEKTRKPFGEWLKLSFDGQVTVTKLGIVSGYDFIDGEGKDYYPLNCRLKEAELIFSTGNTMKVYLDDTRAIQYITIDPPRETSLIRMTVFDVYKTTPSARSRCGGTRKTRSLRTRRWTRWR